MNFSVMMKMTITRVFWKMHHLVVMMMRQTVTAILTVVRQIRSFYVTTVFEVLDVAVVQAGHVVVLAGHVVVTAVVVRAVHVAEVLDNHMVVVAGLVGDEVELKLSLADSILNFLLEDSIHCMEIIEKRRSEETSQL